MKSFEMNKIVKAFFLAGLLPGAMTTNSQAQELQCTSSCTDREQQGKVRDDSDVLIGPVLTNTERDLPNEVFELPVLPIQYSETIESQVILEVNRDDFEPALFDSGKSDLLPAARLSLGELVDRFSARENLRLHFIGHTDNEPLSARTRAIYQTNQGLSESRAQTIASFFSEELQLDDSVVSYEGKGEVEPIATNDTLEGMSRNRRVEVQVWFDEMRTEIVEGVALEREVVCQPENDGRHFSLDEPMFKVSIDGVPTNTLVANSADLQRCTDVALDDSSIRLQYDNLALDPRLSVSLAMAEENTDSALNYSIQGYSNYLLVIDHAELRVFNKGQSSLLDPIAVVDLDESLVAQWKPDDLEPDDYEYLLRVYDADGNYDETLTQPLWLKSKNDEHILAETLLTHYGENQLQRQDIPLTGGSVTVSGKDVPQGHQVFFLGMPVPISEEASFVTQQIVPAGNHGAEIAVIDEVGEGRQYWRELQLPAEDWFYVGLADFTLGQNSVNGSTALLANDSHYDEDVFLDGRLAFYTRGKIDRGYQVTASVDTREEDISDIFSNIDEKDPRSQLRRLEEEDTYSVYGDDSTLMEDAPTQGRFYLKVEDENSHAMWGNFETDIAESDLARIERNLYGAQARWRSSELTDIGENQTTFDFFAAESGTSASYEEFRGTGGSLYYLEHQDITQGSEQISIEVRDKDSGLTLSSQHLVAGQDYEVDSSQGRILLNSPLSSTADDNLLIRSGGLSGNHAYLVINYEFTPGIDRLTDLSVGGRVSHWINDSIKVGLTSTDQEQTGGDQTLVGGDLTVRLAPESYIKLDVANTDGPGVGGQASINGGFDFSNISQDRSAGVEADAWRFEGGFSLEEMGLGESGTANVYMQHRDSGFSGLGLLTQNDTDQVGASLAFDLNESIDLFIKVDDKEESGGAEQFAAELDIGVELNDQWSALIGARTEDSEGYTTLLNEDQGTRTDLAVQLDYEGGEHWTIFGFAQGTVARDDTRAANNRGGLGGSYQVSERMRLNAELSEGNQGFGSQIGTEYQYNSRGSIYLNYELDPDSTDSGLRGRNGQLVSGVNHRYSDTTSIYSEARHQSGTQSGLSHTYGVDYTPSEHWAFGISYENGNIKQIDVAELTREAIGLSAGYVGDSAKYSFALEHRDDVSGIEERSSWLARNNFAYQVSPDWRAQLRVDVALSDSNVSDSFNSDFTEGLLGFAYRPVDNDRFNALVTYHYLEDLAPIGQYTSSGSQADYQQRSQVFAIDATYDLTPRWSVGGKYASRMSELRLGRETGEWVDSDASLYVLRLDWHVVRHWDFMVEGRMLDVEAADDRRSGALVSVNRHLGQNYKVGVGYNFTEFSDDLTNFDFDANGWFVNVVGKF